ncbi:MAG: insulinase family protein [Chthonomonadales bacterium]|nr:insulinase family protein [Chthonomonadales bacterium]
MIREGIEVTTLPNGLRVVSETVDHVQSASVGIWVGVGSRNEDVPVRGITHFIEHMLFKGTAARSARQIADEIESRGGSLNAFTDKEYTCYYARSLATEADTVMDVLTDMLCRSALAPDELALEQNVVLEEIKRHRDTPDDLVHDVFAETMWARHPLGRPIIGTARTVGALTRADLVRYMGAHYTPDRIVLAAAGNVPHAAVVSLAERYLGHLSGRAGQRRLTAPRATGASRLVRRRTEQVHFCLGCPGFRQTDDARYAMTILDMALGGNMSSRLFQEIREKRGLAYSVGTYTQSYATGGVFVVYGGTSPATFEQVVELARAEIEKVRREGLTEDEVSKAKTQLRGALVLGLESMSSRMMRMGKSMLYFGRVVPLEEILAKVDAVSCDRIREMAHAMFADENLTLATVGPLARGTAAPAAAAAN